MSDVPNKLEAADEPVDLSAWKTGLGGDESGAMTLEWALLLAGVAFPSYFLITSALDLLVEHYRLITFINSLPFP